MNSKAFTLIQESRCATAATYGLAVSEQFEDGSVTFTGAKNDLFYFLAYAGGRFKATAFYRFRTEEARDSYATTWEAQRRAAVIAEQERKAFRRKPHSLKVGDVLYSSWGYDQTNIEFYEVTAVRGAVVDLQELQQDRTEHVHGMCGLCTPRPGKYRSAVMAGKRPNGENSVRLTSFSYARP